tara:strand:- start:157 stop:1158 length:1002 start_codon:yes stop_codon:yes gene_type:complete
MIAAANVVTDLYLSAAALCGLFIVHWHFAPAAAFSPLTRRFLLVLRVGMMLFAGRILVVLTGGMWFRFVVLFAAALIPLATLLLTESLLRRHAPRWAKAYVATGALIFGMAAFWVSHALEPVRLYGLLAFQIGGFAITVWLIVMRDRSSLSVGENRTAHRFGLALLVLVPLGASDFLMVALRLPVQISAIGVLILCWFALGLSRVHDGHRQSAYPILMVVFAGALSSAVIALIAEFDPQGIILVLAIILATLLVLALAAVARDTAQRASVLTSLSHTPSTDILTFLQGFATHPLISTANVITADDLDGLDDVVLDRIFAASPVLRTDARPALG